MLRPIPLGLFALLAFATLTLGREREFRLDRPDAQSVGLVGEFNDWKSQPMTRGNGGAWTITIPLAPGLYGYKFLVNGGEWLIDPQSTLRKQVNGIENSAIEVTAEGEGTALGSSTPAPPLPIESAAPAANQVAGDLPLTPGDVTTFDVPLSPSDLLGAYRQAALDAGWVVMAADPPAKPKEDGSERRLALIGAGLDYLGVHLPASKTWPIAAGGFSGGAKRSGYVAAALLKDGRKVIGLLMGGCNGDTASDAAKHMSPPYSYKLVPIFLSSGTTDTIADPEMIHWVEHSMKSNGFRKVRFESYPGAHDVYPAHTTAALQWFIAESSSTGPGPTPKSGFDTFFKKP